MTCQPSNVLSTQTKGTSAHRKTNPLKYVALQTKDVLRKTSNTARFTSTFHTSLQKKHWNNQLIKIAKWDAQNRILLCKVSNRPTGPKPSKYRVKEWVEFSTSCVGRVGQGSNEPFYLMLVSGHSHGVRTTVQYDGERTFEGKNGYSQKDTARRLKRVNRQPSNMFEMYVHLY
jgi:hypothetical protein